MPHKVNKSAPRRPEATRVQKIEKPKKTQVNEFGPLDLHNVVKARLEKKVRSARKAPKVALRKSLVPGAVLIILLGKYEGKKVVFLKQLERSQELLVAGVGNDVPLSRINHKYVIATSTVVDISSVSVDVDDSLFEGPERYSYTSSDDVKNKNKSALETRNVNIAKAQEKIVSQLTSAINKVELLKEYLEETFTLRDGEYPHLLKF